MKKKRYTSRMGYRSKFEERVADSLLTKGMSFGYECEEVAYLKDVRKGECQDCNSTAVGQHCVYLPDFVLTNGIYIEAKGRFTSKDRTKLLAVLRSNNVITRENFRILFQRDNWMTNRKQMTYTEWCLSHSIICAIGPEVPDSWLT